MSLLPWQLSDWTHLHSYILQNRIPQALLIIGKKGLGKSLLANQFANSLLCESRLANGFSCGNCHSCLLSKAETHPDFIAIQPDDSGKSITIDQIRHLINRLTLKPQFDAQRIVMIDAADLMNTRAANAFLKCLEEPTERTSIILITDKPNKLPITIISRCQKLAVATPDIKTVKVWLAQKLPNLTDANISALANLAQGAPLQALNDANNEMLSLRAECFKAWIGIGQQRTHPVAVAENWQKLPEFTVLFWMTSWVIDLIKHRYRAELTHVYNPDFYETLQALSIRLDLKSLYRLYDLLLLSRQRLDTQINKQTLFEELLIQWFQLNEGR
jgi:DNA polymerase-3 subunit delta'